MKKKFINLLVVFTILMSIFGAFGVTVSAAAIITPLSASKDSWIALTGPLMSTDNDAASPYNLKVQNDTNSDNKRITFIEFNLSTITGSITNATLELKCTGIQTSPQTVQAYETVPLLYTWPNGDANDNGMTGANAPAVGAAIPDATVSVTTSGSMYIINVTPYIQSRYSSGAKKVLIALNVASPNFQYVLFNSIEGGAVPKLNVTSTTVPTVSLTAPYNNSYYNVGNSVTASANVKTAGTGVTISSVVFHLDDVSVVGTPTVVGNIYSQVIPSLPLGTHTIKAVATNSDGGVTTSSPMTIKVFDTNTTITKPAPKVYSASAYIEKGIATNYGGATDYNLFIKNDGIDSNDRVSYVKFDLSTISDTIVNATVKLNCNGIQTAGQATQAVQAYQISDDTWTQTGLLPSNAPALGSAIPGAVSNITSGGDIGYFDITSYVNSQIATNDKTISMAFFTEAVTSNYVFFDRFNTRLLLTTTKAPVVSMTSPVNGSRYNPGSSVTLDANVTDTDGIIESVVGYLDENIISLSNTGSVYSATTSNLLVGPHTFKIKATDNLGAVTETTNTINVALPYDYVSSNFTDALVGNGNVVTTLTQGAQIRSNITIKNNDLIALPTTIIIALYNSNNTLKQINFNQSTDIPAGQQQELNVGFTLPNYDLTGYYVKTYLWNNLSNMKPLISFDKIPKP